MKSIALVIAFLFLGLGFAQAQDSTTVMKRIYQNSKTTDSIDVKFVVLDESNKVAIPFARVCIFYAGKQIGFVQTGVNGKSSFTLHYSDLKSIELQALATGYRFSTIKLEGNNFQSEIKFNLNAGIFCIPNIVPVKTFELTPPGQFEMDADFIKHSAYR